MTPADTAPPADHGWPDVRPEAARRLLAAAVNAFAERGYHATTTRDIAANAGMSPAAMYIHYRSKEELLFQISQVGHRRALRVISEAADPAAGPVDRLRSLVLAFAAWHARHHTTARIVQYELGHLAPEHLAEVATQRRAIERVLRNTLNDGVEAGVFDVPDVPGATLAILSLCIDVARWYRPEGRHSPETIGDLYADLAVRMVS